MKQAIATVKKTKEIQEGFHKEKLWTEFYY